MSDTTVIVLVVVGVLALVLFGFLTAYGRGNRRNSYGGGDSSWFFFIDSDGGSDCGDSDSGSCSDD